MSDSSHIKIALVVIGLIGVLGIWGVVRENRLERNRSLRVVTNTVPASVTEAFDRGIFIGANAALQLAATGVAQSNTSAQVLYEFVKTNPASAGLWNQYHP